MEQMVTIKNYSNSRVGFIVPNRQVKRVFMPGMSIPVVFEEAREALYDRGISNMFRYGILAIDDKEMAAKLGLINVPVEEGGVGKVADKEEIKKVLNGKTSELLAFLKEAAPATKEALGQAAVEERIVDPTKMKLIEEHTGVSVINALKRASDSEE